MNAPEVAITAKPTRADYYGGLLLNARHSRWTIFTVLFVPPMAALWALYTSNTPGQGGFRSLILFLLTFLGATMGTILQAQIGSRNAMRAPGGGAETIYTFSSNGIAAQNPVASGPSSWAVWNGAFESKRVLTVRSKRGVIVVIPKHGIGEDLLEPIRAMLRAHIRGPVRLWRGVQPS